MVTRPETDDEFRERLASSREDVLAAADRVHREPGLQIDGEMLPSGPSLVRPTYFRSTVVRWIHELTVPLVPRRLSFFLLLFDLCRS